jgi:hypothetical protein
MKLVKLLLAALGVTVLFGILASSAFGRNFSTNNQSIRASFSEVKFHFPGTTVACHVILDGSLHRTSWSKLVGSLVGYITRAELGTCTTGMATILRETLPWHVRYSAFEGRLPDIRSIVFHIVDVGWRIREAGGINCLARSSAAEPVIWRWHIDVSHHATVGLEGSIRTGFECFGVAGSFTTDSPQLVLSNTATAISISLI